MTFFYLPSLMPLGMFSLFNSLTSSWLFYFKSEFTHIFQLSLFFDSLFKNVLTLFKWRINVLFVILKKIIMLSNVLHLFARIYSSLLSFLLELFKNCTYYCFFRVFTLTSFLLFCRTLLQMIILFCNTRSRSFFSFQACSSKKTRDDLPAE